MLFDSGFVAGGCNERVQRAFFLNENLVSLSLLDRLYEVADLALEHDVGGEALAGFGIEAGEVASVGVSVGVSVFAVEEVEEVVAVIHCSDFF